MRIGMLATASAVAFVFAIGSVSAADQFKTLKGVKAVQMTAGELSSVKGMDHHFQIITPGTTVPLDPAVDADDGPLETDGRFGTDHHQDDLVTATDDRNFITIIRADNGNPMRVSPAYNGLANACGNGVIIMPGFIAC